MKEQAKYSGDERQTYPISIHVQFTRPHKSQIRSKTKKKINQNQKGK